MRIFVIQYFWRRGSICVKTICFLFLLLNFNINAQSTYKLTYGISKIKFHGSIDNLDERGKQFTEKLIENSKEIKYILYVNKAYSYFEAKQALKKENESSLQEILTRMAKRFKKFNEKVFVNKKKDSLIFVKNLVDKDFKVKRSNYDFNWIIKDKTKMILNFKAKNAIGSYYYPITNQKFEIQAWFLPSIPLQSGPDIFMGLPGLIAEVNLNGTVVKLEKIEKTKSSAIKKLDDSEAMTQKEFEDLISRLTKKFIDN